MVELLTSEEARFALGQIGRTTLHQLNRRGVLQSVRIGKRRMYLASSVDEFIQSQVELGSSATETATAAEPRSDSSVTRRKHWKSTDDQ